MATGQNRELGVQCWGYRKPQELVPLLLANKKIFLTKKYDALEKSVVLLLADFNAQPM